MLRRMHSSPRVGACLSLSGRYARFGSQAARALRVWAALDGDAEPVIEDDGSDPGMPQALLPEVAAGCYVLLGPYSTQLARAGLLRPEPARPGRACWAGGIPGPDPGMGADGAAGRTEYEVRTNVRGATRTIRGSQSSSA